jgi:replicative DNA helicase
MISHTERSNFSLFGYSFQTKAIQACLLDQTFYERVHDILLLEYFDQTAHNYIYKFVLDYYTQYKLIPTIESVEIFIRSIKDDALRTECDLVLNDVKKGLVSDLEYIKDKILVFCRNQKMKRALFAAVDYLASGKFDEIYRVVKEALNAGEPLDLGHDFFVNLDKRILMAKRFAISSGWKFLDKYMNGGFGKGELIIIMSPTSGGKSFWLAHAGANALKQGKTVLHYSFELYEHQVGNRYDAIISGIPIEQLEHQNEFVRKKLNEFVEKTQSRLIIKFFPTKTASVSTLRNHISKLAQYNIIPDMVIVDYADLMNSRRHYEQKRLELESVYEDLRATAAELQVPVISASQTNRSGLDEEVITMAAIAESFAKAQVADVILTLSRRYEDRIKNRGKLFIAKNRAGIDGIILPVMMDTIKATFEVFDKQEEFDITKEFADDQGINQPHLTKKYTLHENNNKK